MYLRKTMCVMAVMVMCMLPHSALAMGSFSVYGIFMTRDLNVKAKTFSGSGYLWVENATIECDECLFKGTINCNGVCEIYAKKDFNYMQFKRGGGGRFIITICPYDRERHSQSSLLFKAENLLFRNILSLTDEQFNQSVAELRHHASLNGLNEQKLVQDIQQKMEKLMAKPEEYLRSSVHEGHLKAGAGLVGLWLASGIKIGGERLATIRFSNRLRKISNAAFLVIGAGSAVCMVDALRHFTAAARAEREAKIAQDSILLREKLVWMQAQLKELFAQAYVSPMKVIHL